MPTRGRTSEFALPKCENIQGQSSRIISWHAAQRRLLTEVTGKPAEEVPPAPAEEEEADEEADEYARSIGDVGVSKDTFKEDKEKILRIIDELSVIMKDKDYKAWLPYIDSESKSYWSKTGNLKKAQNRMPIKGIQLKTLQDYFKFIFVPARQQSQITEIRYESDTYIKAVEVQPTQELIYYFFKKTNGNWLVHIPPIEE